MMGLMGSRPALLAIGCLLLPLACAPALVPEPAQVSPDRRLDEEAVLRPAGPPAGWYDLRRPASVRGLEAQILAQIHAMALRLGKPVPLTDEAAQRAARDVC